MFVNYFIFPLTIDISTISPSYCSYKPTERYLGGTTLCGANEPQKGDPRNGYLRWLADVVGWGLGKPLAKLTHSFPKIWIKRGQTAGFLLFMFEVLVPMIQYIIYK